MTDAQLCEYSFLKIIKLYNLTGEGLGAWLKWLCTCVASMRPRV
jgi:hypothetical protein